MKTFWQFSQEKNLEQNSEKNLQISDQNPIKNTLEKSISERGFYLYEWISEAELRDSIHADYLMIMTHSAKPLFWTTTIFGFLGFFIKSYTGAIFAISGVIGIFYVFVFLYLIFTIFKKWQIFTNFANIPITDTHIVAGGKILNHNDYENRNKVFGKTEEYFHEKFLGESMLPEKISEQKNTIKKSFSEIFSQTGKIFENMADFGGKEMWFIVIILSLVGAIFGSMMGITYFLGLPVVFFLARIFSKIFRKILLAKNNQEYKIQDFFEKIDKNSLSLQNEKEKIIFSLNDAKNNEWKENLSGKISESFSLLNGHTNAAIDESLALRKLLENSKYKEIFNFSKYDSWIKNEILAPINELLSLIDANLFTLSTTNTALCQQIDATADPSHRTPLELQKTRLERKVQEFIQMKNLLENHKQKLENN